MGIIWAFLAWFFWSLARGLVYAPGITMLNDGWTDPGETWTYASATTFTVPDGTRYQKGDRIKLTQTTVKYFVVVSVSGNTLTITGGADYTLANAAITSPYYSREASPLGYPSSFTWTPGFTGFSSAPTVIAAGTIFRVVGNIVTVIYERNADGTSNATTFTITGLPISAARAFTYLAGVYGVNNSVNIRDATSGALEPIGASLLTTVLTLHKDGNGNGWTNSGSKGIYAFVLEYEF